MTGGKGLNYNTHGLCKRCEKWFEKPTQIRCNCCGMLIRQNNRFSKAVFKKVVKRIE